jgi:hypothetical protein
VRASSCHNNDAAQRAAPGACSSAKKEKRRRRCPANAAHCYPSKEDLEQWPLMFLKRSDSRAIDPKIKLG